MEENNGRAIEHVNGNVNVEDLLKENTQLKKYLKQAVDEIQSLKQTWALQRANFLFKVVECNEFNSEFKVKAIEELEEFLYPKEEKDNNEPKNE